MRNAGSQPTPGTDLAQVAGPVRRSLSRRKTLPPRELARRLRRVKLFLCDVDGILTDATVYMGGGVETKRFHIQDGLGLRFLQRFGIQVGWVSARPSEATTQRAEDLKVNHLIQAPDNKAVLVASLLAKTGMGWDETLFMGDDLVDLPALMRVGVAVTVPAAVAEARRVADYITRAGGGDGAVREVVELVLKAQGHWPELVNFYGI